VTRLINDPAIGATLRTDLRTASHRPAWSVHEEAGADMVGELISGRHRVVRRLARGGMADVFLAKDTARKCQVAIKILRSRRTEARRRFKVEAEILSNLQHPNIVRAVDVGEIDGQPFMALEFIDGEPLSSRLARGPLPWRAVVKLGIEAADAVHALHEAGIVHRDLKPDNIMITGGDRPAVKLIDLGLASVGGSFHDAQDARFTPEPHARHQTQLGYPIGTPAYLPQEAGQCPAEPRLDVYSLAATLYQLCTQLLPRDTGNRPIREVCEGSDAPDDLSRLLQAALASEQAERLPSADHLRRGLEAILTAHPESGPRHLYGGSYDLLEVLGVGASAVVYRASDRALSREVAIKVMRDGATSDDDVIRFRRAAKVLSALNHPSIPPIHHFGTHVGQRFAVTALCTGVPATHYARPDCHLRPDEVLSVGLAIGGALAAVHAAGVVYRDLHPGNVLIARGDPLRAWIFDFDQAQVSARFYAARTERWATPPEERQEPRLEKRLQAMDYASPEVRGGAPFTAQSDVYALGLLLYRLLTGRRPFSASGELVSPRQWCRCPLGLEGLIRVMLEPSPDRRPALAGVLLTLEDELAELTADLADAAALAMPVVEADEDAVGERPKPSAAGDDETVTAEPGAAALATTADVGAASGPHNVEPVARRRRGSSLWALGLTAVVSVAIGRATVPRATDVDGASPSTIEAAVDTDGSSHSAWPVEVQPPSVEPPPVEPPPVEPPSANTPGPASALPAALKREPSTRAPRREAVSSREATTAAERALPTLRACNDVPRRVTADLDIVRGHGVVAKLNLRAPEPDHPLYAWHACARQALESVRYPVSDTSVRVQVRLTLP
jgi:serine/threonine protein kinase